MMSLSAIKSISAKAARKAAKERKLPIMVWQDDFVDNMGHRQELLREHLRHMPFLGDYVPRGYELSDEFFVDSTGFGNSRERALTQEDFLSRVQPGHAYAITEAGQFQVYVGEYRLKKDRLKKDRLKK